MMEATFARTARPFALISLLVAVSWLAACGGNDGLESGSVQDGEVNTGLPGEYVRELWSARYDGVVSRDDNGYVAAVGPLGNVYVAGESEGSDMTYDYATAKYDSSGNELWVARYDGSGNDTDQPWALAVDDFGNAYVTGRSRGINTSDDYATLKYDSDGKQVWAARYDNAVGDLDWAYALAVDSSGNVYVTGTSIGLGTARDFATVKYDAAGKELWVARYDGPGSGDDPAYAVAVDSFGNVIVTGRSFAAVGLYDYATIKYDSVGNELWVARYNGPADDWDWARNLAVDDSGNVYVTGRSRGVGTSYDYVTIKYATDGKELWVARYDGPASGDDIARDLAVDSSGNVYVTGRSQGVDTSYDYVTIKYAGDGKELWVARYDGPASSADIVRDMTLDDSGSVYVTGWSRGDGTADDYATIKYDTSGNPIWLARYDGAAGGRDEARAVAIGDSGNVYVTGRSAGNGTSFDYITLSYSR